MPPTTAVTLDTDLATFIDAQFRTGRYRSASDVVRAGLHFLMAEETRRTALQAALIEAEQSGLSPRTVQDIWAEAQARTPPAPR
jgi:antitoxin ParD1/3/4